MMRKVLVLTSVALSLLVAGCNTVAGMGRDVSAVGHAVTQSSKDVAH